MYNSSPGNVDYRKKYFDLIKQNKERAFITEDGDGAADEDDSDNEEHVNLVLMAIGDEADSISTLPMSTKLTSTLPIQIQSLACSVKQVWMIAGYGKRNCPT